MQAVYWKLDHALRLYPLPHSLILADSAPAADFVEKKSGCVCINPVRHLPSPSACTVMFLASHLKLERSQLANLIAWLDECTEVRQCAGQATGAALAFDNS